MDYQQLIAQMTPDIYLRLKRSVELGRWPDGGELTVEQRGNALQAMIAWGEQHLPPAERVGFIDRGAKAGADDPSRPAPLNWKD